ncbi:MAG: MBL fold metallo-hydrolase [Christensenellales bacterium]
MSKKAANLQKKIMSRMFRGKGIFKPLNTGFIDEHVASLREWVANIFFYTKNGNTIMIDAGYNYDRLEEKMSWLCLNPKEIKHIFITHQDTDHMGAVERESALLFKHATLYLGEIENRYLTGEVRRKVFRGLYRLPKVKTDNKKILLKDGQVFYIYDIKVECILVPGHTWGHMVYLVDDRYLFTGDTIWLGIDGGYSFLSVLAEDNKLSLQSLARLKRIIKGKQRNIKVITGHTGYTDDLDFAFAHIDKICSPFSKTAYDPVAPYDGYDESDDTKENAEKANRNMQRKYHREGIRIR